MRPGGYSFVLTLAAGITFGFCIAFILHTLVSIGPLADRTALIGSLLLPANDSVAVEVSADDLYNRVRVLCWVLTMPENHEARARHVKQTWGKRCNILVFISSKEDETLPAVAVPAPEGRDHLWSKTREAFHLVWQKYHQQVDWFMKADDDTYVIVENLRYLLSAYKADRPLWFGHKFKPYVKRGYFSGGAGYVLSREALRRFVHADLSDKKCTNTLPKVAEDVQMGLCMEALHVASGDSRDSYGRNRFLPFIPEHHLIPGPADPQYWYWDYVYYPPKQGPDCCSDTAISFHYVTPNEMYVLDYLVYQLRPYGIKNQLPDIPEPPPDQDLVATPWKGLLNDNTTN